MIINKTIFTLTLLVGCILLSLFLFHLPETNVKESMVNESEPVTDADLLKWCLVLLLLLLLFTIRERII